MYRIGYIYLFYLSDIRLVKASDKKLLKAFGNHVRALREKQKISQGQLAYECESHRTVINRIENGNMNTSVVSLAKIAKALNVSLSELLDFE